MKNTAQCPLCGNKEIETWHVGDPCGKATVIACSFCGIGYCEDDEITDRKAQEIWNREVKVTIDALKIKPPSQHVEKPTRGQCPTTQKGHVHYSTSKGHKCDTECHTKAQKTP